MKKLVFSAIACVAFAGNGFASNEIVFEKQDFLAEMSKNSEITESGGNPCKVYVWATGPDGKSDWKSGDGGSLSYDDCGKYKDGFVKDLREKGFTFEEENIKVIWG